MKHRIAARRLVPAAPARRRYQVGSTTSGTRVADWYARVGGVSNALTSLRVSYRGKSSATCTQELFVRNQSTGVWVRLHSRSVGTSEVSVAVTPTGVLAHYVSGATGDGVVDIRARCSRGDGLSFYVSGDAVSVTSTTP